ncbi:unnamed protein product [Acanthoscelides obtectus]|uniref:Purple acid phosphatase N-terminal domain-containing protein n=1 Tax=Acanthoscelides obtectus TaxID=200917 RepID=A0A9P0LB94_ACAOB|nr:unnamed protein product [Acanthoscelides obtectus]CAK1663502.1 Acid phosphatase type 7 [Acanthoscelides obtectus]
MNSQLLYYSILVLIIGGIKTDILYYQPEQVHISYGSNLYEIAVTWSTFSATNGSIVEYGIRGMILRAEGSERLFVDGGANKHFQYIHRVILKDLQPGSRYEYHCGSTLGWSDIFFFNTPPDSDAWVPHIALFGDMGNENAQSLVRLQEEAQRGMYDTILHVGDFAYDMDSVNYQNVRLLSV